MEPNFPTHYREGHYNKELYDLAYDISKDNFDVDKTEFRYNDLKAKLLRDVYDVKPLEANRLFNNFWKELDDWIESKEDASPTLDCLSKEIIDQVNSVHHALTREIPKLYCEPDKRITEEDADLIIQYVKEHFEDNKE